MDSDRRRSRSSRSLYESTTSALTPDSSVVHYAGGILYLFSGAVLVGALSIVGLRPGKPRWIAVALCAAVATWSLIWVGVLLSAAGADSLQFGYWVILAGIVIAVGGTALVIWSARHPDVPATEQTELHDER